MRWRYEGRSSWKHPVAAGGLVGARGSLRAGGRLVKRLCDVRAAQSGVMVTHFTGQITKRNVPWF
jgi:hypothetical protein